MAQLCQGYTGMWGHQYPLLSHIGSEGEGQNQGCENKDLTKNSEATGCCQVGLVSERKEGENEKQ